MLFHSQNPLHSFHTVFLLRFPVLGHILIRNRGVTQISFLIFCLVCNVEHWREITFQIIWNEPQDLMWIYAGWEVQNKFDDSICITLCANPTDTFNRCKTHNSGMICCENDSSPDFYRPDGISRHTISRIRKVKYHTSRSLARNYRVRRNNMGQTKPKLYVFLHKCRVHTKKI